MGALLRKDGLSAVPVPLSAYDGSSKDLEDLKFKMSFFVLAPIVAFQLSHPDKK